MKTREAKTLKLAILLGLTPFLATGCSVMGKMEFGKLVTSGRDGWQLPEVVVASLALEPGDNVAEIGAGEGYWLPWLSAAVGPDGRVYAVEVTDELVDALESRVAEEELTNVVVIRGAFEDPMLPDGEIDLAMTSLTYHHIEGQVGYFARLRRNLSERGRVAHLDDRPDIGIPFQWFQGDGHWTDPDVIAREMRESGYRRTLTFDFLPMQSFQVFAPSVGSAVATDPTDDPGE